MGHTSVHTSFFLLHQPICQLMVTYRGSSDLEELIAICLTTDVWQVHIYSLVLFSGSPRTCVRGSMLSVLDLIMMVSTEPSFGKKATQHISSMLEPRKCCKSLTMMSTDKCMRTSSLSQSSWVSSQKRRSLPEGFINLCTYVATQPMLVCSSIQYH